MFKLDRRQMQRAMRQLGVKTRELEGVKEVLIRLEDRELVFPNAQVILTEMGGQRSYQVIGREIERRLEAEPNEDDVKLVMEQAGVERGPAVQALKETGGDLAEAILRLKGQSA
jgi:nascent polypeptide-associated complex subunit alpha